MLSKMDDFPLHQIADTIRHVGTSDRNFYDRYYFMLHACSDDLFMVMGLGQYPNLGVQDAFAVVRRGTQHRVIRASRVLGDRADTTVGPLRVEVIEGLRELRFVIEANEHGIEADLRWKGVMPAFQEPRQHIRKYGRTLFDTMRFVQTGCWEGTLAVAGETFQVTPERWWGVRDRSWGVRPVGEPEPPGIRQGEGQMDGMWNYAPMQFRDHSILYMCHERDNGERVLEEGVRIWHDPARAPEALGRPEHEPFRRHPALHGDRHGPADHAVDAHIDSTRRVVHDLDARVELRQGILDALGDDRPGQGGRAGSGRSHVSGPHGAGGAPRSARGRAPART